MQVKPEIKDMWFGHNYILVKTSKKKMGTIV